MGKIRVHLHDPIQNLSEGPRRNPLDRPSRAPSSWVGVQNLKARLLAGELFGQAAGPVWGIVIYDEHLKVEGKGQKFFQEPGQIFPLVISGDDDKDPMGHRILHMKLPGVDGLYPKGRGEAQPALSILGPPSKFHADRHEGPENDDNLRVGKELISQRLEGKTHQGPPAGPGEGPRGS